MGLVLNPGGPHFCWRDKTVLVWSHFPLHSNARVLLGKWSDSLSQTLFLDQVSPNFFVLHNVIVAGYVIFYEINKFFESILYIIFSLLTKWLRGPD